MSRDLPAEWIATKIGDIADKCSQRKPLDDEKFIYVDIGSIDRVKKVISSPQQLFGKDAPSRARKIISRGDVIVSLTRPNLNAVALVSDDYDNQIASTGFEVLKPCLIESKYLFAIVRSREFIDSISGKVQGALYPAAKATDVREFRIPLPPLPEQKQIAATLDQLLARVEAIKIRLDAIPALLKRFRQSVLAAAVSGRLTEEWRGHSNYEESAFDENWKWEGVPAGWAVKLYPDLVDSRLGKMLDKAKNSGISTSYLGNINVRWFSFNLEKLQDIRVTENEIHELAVQPGDVLICEGGEPGRAAIWQITNDKPIVFQKALHRARVGTEIVPEWLVFNLKNDADSNRLEQLFTGTTIKHLTGKALKKYPIRVPPKNEQTQIVHRVEQLFAFADQIEQRLAAARGRVEHLTQSILAKAFRGELTAQWRADHPELISGEHSAQALLDRIKAERAAAAPKKRPRKKSRRRSGASPR